MAAVLFLIHLSYVFMLFLSFPFTVFPFIQVETGRLFFRRDFDWPNAFAVRFSSVDFGSLWSHARSKNHYSAELDMGPFFLIQSNPIQKLLVLKLIRKLGLMWHYLS